MMPENALWSYPVLNVRNLFTTSNNLLRIQGMSCTCRLTFLPLPNLLWFIPALTVPADYTKYPRNLQSAFPIHLQLALKSHHTISALAPAVQPPTPVAAHSRDFPFLHHWWTQKAFASSSYRCLSLQTFNWLHAEVGDRAPGERCLFNANLPHMARACCWAHPVRFLLNVPGLLDKYAVLLSPHINTRRLLFSNSNLRINRK